MVDLKNVLRDCVKKGNQVIDSLKEINFSPDSIKKLDVGFNLSEAARLIGVSRESIRKAELSGKLKGPKINKKNNRRNYFLKEINEYRLHFGTRNGRREGDETAIIAFINFKGGVYKSSTSLHFSQYMALKGYRVLFVDADSQATSTQFFGITPDNFSNGLETFSPYFTGEIDSLEKCIIKTCWDGLDLIPADLSLYNAELETPVLAARGAIKGGFYNLLREGLDTVKNNYDLIIIDAPPSLGIISMNVIYAANCLIIPTPPLFADFASTLTFFTMLEDVAEHLGNKEFSFIKLLITKYDGSEEAKEFIKVIRHVFGSDRVLRNIFSNTAEIPRASQDLKTVYEVSDPRVKKTYNRALEILNRVNGELELLIKSTWPSYASEMLEVGVI